MLSLFLISFVAGVLTVLAPCVLPLLPVIVGRSMSEETSSRRLFVVALSLSTSVFIFTLLLKVSTALISIPASFWQIVSGGLLIFFGLVTLWPALWDNLPFVQALYRSSNRALGTGMKKQSVWGDVIMGAALGPVFSSCSPTYFVILAAVLPIHFASGLLCIALYSAGLCLSLFAVAFLGQKAALKLGFITESGGLFKKFIGVIFILLGVAIILGLDKKLEIALPTGAYGEVTLEQKLFGGDENSSASSTAAATTSLQQFLTLTQKDAKYKKAPELVSPDGFVNTNDLPVTLAQYKGKNVVLIDFWDYSCINCERTIPYLNAWYEKYKDQGLVVIGVHTPEFAFEQLKNNVTDAAARFGIKYPIVLDNHYQTWNAFQNQYWPREYLVDIDGYIVHDHAGEGDYDITEKAIQDALAERASRLGTSGVSTSTVNISPIDTSNIYSPETYFGSARNEYLGNGQSGVAGNFNFTLPKINITPNTLYLSGKWNVESEFAETGPGSKIVFQYGAHDVYIVAGNPSSPVKIKVLRDGVPVGTFAGEDVNAKTSEALINGDRLYRLIHDRDADVHTIEIDIEEGTLDAYTFTFG